MELQLVNFEQAKALKELGFPQNEPKHYNYFGVLTDGIQMPPEAVAPTLELVAKWLREEKKVFIPVKILFIETYGTIDIKYHSEVETISNNTYYAPFASKFMDSYEEALSAGIDSAIEYLKKNTIIE